MSTHSTIRLVLMSRKPWREGFVAYFRFRTTISGAYITVWRLRQSDKYGFPLYSIALPLSDSLMVALYRNLDFLRNRGEEILITPLKVCLLWKNINEGVPIFNISKNTSSYKGNTTLDQCLDTKCYVYLWDFRSLQYVSSVYEKVRDETRI